MDKMSEQQWKRLDLVKRLDRGLLTVAEAGVIAGITERQMRRVREKVHERGKAALVHGNKGRPPPNRIEEKTRSLVIELFRTKYAGFNDQHFTEKLAEEENIVASRPSIRRWLRAAGLAAARKHRPPKHRARRDRKAQAGLMLLWDGSRHDWLEGRGPLMTLMGAVDDATSELLPGAHFVEQECTVGYLRVLRDVVRERGVPYSIYMDMHGTLKRNDAHWTVQEELSGKQIPTHVGRALEILNIEAIFALSSQAKGRVERQWNTQDRLVSELRLAKVCTLEKANGLLARLLPKSGRRFAIAARDEKPAWRKLLREIDLDRVCSFFYETTVLNDNTVRIAGLLIDIPPGPQRRSYAQARVEVRQLLDGSWRVYFQNQEIARAASTATTELRALKRRKLGATSKAFRKAIRQLTG